MKIIFRANLKHTMREDRVIATMELTRLTFNWLRRDGAGRLRAGQNVPAWVLARVPFGP